MSDRGEYRAIRRVLLNGKDFRHLPERARFAFLCLKLNLGPAGIEDWEPEALVVTLAAQMGATPDQVRIALDILDHEGWISRDENVVWVVEQLTHDPHIKQADAKHRKSIQRHVSGLPNLPIREAFMAHYRPWFEDQDSPIKPHPKTRTPPKKALRRPIEAPSTKPKSDNESEERTVDDAGASSGANWVSLLGEDYASIRKGKVPFGEIGKALKSLHEEHGIAVLRPAFVRFLNSPKAQYGVTWFAKNLGDFLSDRGPALSEHNAAVRASRDAFLKPIREGAA